MNAILICNNKTRPLVFIEVRGCRRENFDPKMGGCTGDLAPELRCRG